jgi:hypothetical protein
MRRRALLSSLLLLAACGHSSRAADVSSNSLSFGVGTTGNRVTFHRDDCRLSASSLQMKVTITNSWSAAKNVSVGGTFHYGDELLHSRSDVLVPVGRKLVTLSVVVSGASRLPYACELEPVAVSRTPIDRVDPVTPDPPPPVSVTVIPRSPDGSASSTGG